MEKELHLRITIVDPPAGVVFGLQRGEGDVVSPRQSGGEPLSFDFDILVREASSSEPARLTGPFVKGPINARFVYINSGTLAGQADSRWTRRAKVPLQAISPVLIEKALARPGTLLEARINGTAADGGPTCAMVSLRDGGWAARPAAGKRIGSRNARA